MAETNYPLFQEELPREESSSSTLLVVGAFFLGALLASGIIFGYLLLGTQELQSVPTTTTNPPEICDPSQQNMKTFSIFTEEKIYGFQKTWYEAMADCHRRGMLFASIESEEEYAEILNLVFSKHEVQDAGPGDGIWVSGTDLGHSSYIWMSTGLEMTYQSWYRDADVQEPTNGDLCDGDLEHCVELLHMYDYHWNDNCCHKRNGYVCETRDC